MLGVDKIIHLRFPKSDKRKEHDIFLSASHISAVNVIDQGADDYYIQIIVDGHPIVLPARTEVEKVYILSKLGL